MSAITLWGAMQPLYLHLPILIVIISLIYSATRYDQWGAILREAFRWGLRMFLFLAGIVLILWGIAWDDASMALRASLTGGGIILEIGLLFIK